MDNLPSEVIIEICKFSDYQQLLLVSKQFNLLVNNLWDIYLERDFKDKISMNELDKNKSNSKTNSKTNSTKKTKLSSNHKELITKYSMFEGQYIWSPAKISQICLTYIDSNNYYDDIILSLEKEYEEQCKLL